MKAAAEAAEDAAPAAAAGGKQPTFHRSWELQDGKETVVAFGPCNKELQTTPRARIAKHVASTAEVGLTFLFSYAK